MMGYGDNYNGCPGAAYMGEDGWNNQGQQKFLEDTASIRRELNSKHFEYSEIMRNPETNRETLASLEREIVDLKKQPREKAEQY